MRGLLIRRLPADVLKLLPQMRRQPLQRVDLAPLGGHDFIQLGDHLILMGDAHFECVESVRVGHWGEPCGWASNE